MKKKKKIKIDVRRTKSFQIKQAKELGMTLEQYLGLEPILVIHFDSKKN